MTRKTSLLVSKYIYWRRNVGHYYINKSKLTIGGHLLVKAKGDFLYEGTAPLEFHKPFSFDYICIKPQLCYQIILHSPCSFAAKSRVLVESCC